MNEIHTEPRCKIPLERVENCQDKASVCQKIDIAKRRPGLNFYCLERTKLLQIDWVIFGIR